MSKRLGRPKGKNKPKDAGTLLHVVLSPKAKQRLEQVRMYYRCEAYGKTKNGATPSALPRINNETLIDLLIDNVYHMTILLGIEEGPEQ